MVDAYIYDALRTPRGRGKASGSLYEVRPLDLLKPLFQALETQTGLDPNQVDDVVLGCVTPIGEQGGNIARAAVLHAGWGNHAPGVSLNRFCASGLEAINLAAAKVASGFDSCVVAGGVESMSRVPMGSDGGALFLDPVVNGGQLFVPQGIGADLIATLAGFSREQLDSLALRSHQAAAHAQASGFFSRSLVPVRDLNGLPILEHDEMVRADCTLAGLMALRPSFQKMGELAFDETAKRRYPEVERVLHHHHAGNSSAIVDGAALVLLGSREAGDALGLKPRARIRTLAAVGSEPTIMLTGPTPATRTVLKRAGLSVADIDLFEINEAFAAVVLNTIRDLEIDPERVNVNGGAIALGHPLGASGAMLLGTALDELERRDRNLALITLCVGGGMGVATLIERV